MNEHDDGPPAPALPDEPWGDVPAQPESLPGVITVQATPMPETLEQDAWTFLNNNPAILKHIRALKQDVIAHRTEIIFGAGLATTLAATIGAVVLIRHKKRGKP